MGVFTWLFEKLGFRRKPKKKEERHEDTIVIEDKPSKLLTRDDLIRMQVEDRKKLREQAKELGIKTVETPIKYKKKPSPKRTVKEETKKIDGAVVNHYNFSITPDTAYSGRESVENMMKYQVLLKGKISDKELMQDIIKNESISQALIKKRTAMQVRVMETRIFGVFEVIGVLPEDEEAIQSFWLGRTIDSNEWQRTLGDFEAFMDGRNRPVIRVVSVQAPVEKMVVKQIDGSTTLK